MPRPNLKPKPLREYPTRLDLPAEVSGARSAKALSKRLLELRGEFETAQRNYSRRAKNPRNLVNAQKWRSKAEAAASSKKRCSLILHALMHETRAPGMAAADWNAIAGLMKGAKKSA